MIRIAVCDDENVIVNQIEHIISEVCKRESIPVNINVFYSGRELKRQVTSGTKYDIIFLDIQMKGGDGITAAENIRKVDDNVLLIYVSGYDKYMMELFRLDVFGFIRESAVKWSILPFLISMKNIKFYVKRFYTLKAMPGKLQYIRKTGSITHLTGNCQR